MSPISLFGRLRSRVMDLPRDQYPDMAAYGRARALRALMAFVAVLLLALLPIFALIPTDEVSTRAVLTTLPILLTAWALFWMAGRGERGLKIAGAVLIPLLLIVGGLAAMGGHGILDPNDALPFTAVVLSAVVLDEAGILVTTGAAVLVLLGMAYLTARGFSGHPPAPLSAVYAATASNAGSAAFIGLALFFSRVLQRRLLFESVQQAKAKDVAEAKALALAEANEVKTTLINTVSHEFRTPLTLTLGLIDEALADASQPLPAVQKERLLNLRKQDGRLHKLVNALLDFAQLEAGRSQLAFEPVDLSVFTAELARDFRGPMERAGLDFVVDCPTLEEPVYVDRSKWEKIVLNLLSNALKYTLSGEVALTLRRGPPGPDALGGEKGEYAELVVRDTGCGIAPDDQRQLFQRFHRVHRAPARTSEGTGLGLALTRELVRLHGGTITVDSAPDKGSTFRVRLPFGRAHLPAESSLTPPAVPAPQGSPSLLQSGLAQHLDQANSFSSTPAKGQQAMSDKGEGRILVVEDRKDLRDRLVELLGQRFSVQGAQSAEEALHLVREHPPDLLISDVVMAGMSGLDLLRTVRRDPRTRALPVILLTGLTGEANTVLGLSGGADDYLTKPFSTQELLARVEVHLDLHLLRQKAVASREEFVRLVTHELRSPLSVIKGYCQLVYGRMRKEGAKDAEFLAKMERSVDRMETLVNDLVDVSHIESGKLELSRERCDLCELCRDAVDEQAALHRDVDLSLPEGPVWVHADPGRIAQVLTNLLTNAFKYGDGTHPVSLVLTEETGGARLQVIDKGPGIPEEQLAHVFERFYRALGNKHAGGAFGGLGLGLYLCRELVERHNGTIEAKSTPGEGSTFTVTLPLGG